MATQPGSRQKEQASKSRRAKKAPGPRPTIFELLWEDRDLSDFALVCGGYRLKCHRLVLAYHSEVFGKLIHLGPTDSSDSCRVFVDHLPADIVGEFSCSGRVTYRPSPNVTRAKIWSKKQLRRLKKAEVVVDDVPPDVMEAILEFCYKGKVTYMTVPSLEKLLEGLAAVDRYEVTRAKRWCEEQLSRMVAPETLAVLCRASESCHASYLRAFIKNFIKENLQDLVKADLWNELPEEITKEALQSK